MDMESNSQPNLFFASSFLASHSIFTVQSVWRSEGSEIPELESDPQPNLFWASILVVHIYSVYEGAEVYRRLGIGV